MIPRPDLLDRRSPKGLEVFQLTTEKDVPSSHIYMEAQIFTPDSKRFVLHRSAHAHGSDRKDPAHKYLLCDVANDCELTPITDELGTTGPSISPDGRWLYYFVNETEFGSGQLTLKRVRLDGTGRETIVVIENPIRGAGVSITQIYPLSTISSDGNRIMISGFFGDGKTENAPWGYVWVDIRKAEVQAVSLGGDWCNLHPQYSRSLDRKESRDVLIQHNHGANVDGMGAVTELVGGAGADIHVIREDGTDLRDMPWGRDGNEFCQGHQCWRGRMRSAVSSMDAHPDHHLPLVESLPMRCSEHHLGKRLSGAMRNVITRDVELPAFCHFAFDPTGTKFVSDTYIKEDLRGRGGLFIGSLDPAPGAALRLRHLLFPRSSWQHGQQSHPHPFLSPDGTKAFFNSDESGQPQIYMIRGFEYP